jgi:hypothetical protein
MDERTDMEGLYPIAVDQPAFYEFKILGRLSEGAKRQFDDMQVTVSGIIAGIPVTEITGQVADQAALHGLISRIRDRGLPLLLVKLVRPIGRGEDGI